MRTPPAIRKFENIVLKPHAGQFVIDELPTLVLCSAGWVYGGVEGLPLTVLVASVSLLLSLFCSTVSSICAGYVIASVRSSLSASMGFYAARWIIWNCTALWTSGNTKVSSSSSAV